MDRFGHQGGGGLRYDDSSDDDLELIHGQGSPNSDNLDDDIAEHENFSDVSSHISLSSESEQSEPTEDEESDGDEVEEVQPVEVEQIAWLLNGIPEGSQSPHPHSSDGSVRSDSRSSSESPSSVDSLFVDQRHEPDLFDDEGIEREANDIQQELYGLLEDRQRLEFAERIEQNARQLRELGERIRQQSEAIQRESRRRHQPYPPPHPRRNREVDLFGDHLFEEDELVEMEVARRRAREQRNRAADQAARRRTPPAVIDLTEEPDSPDDLVIVGNGNRRNRAQQPAQAAPRPIAAPRNPRRQGSLNHRTPSLARSDGSILGGAEVIDLTEMDDDAPRLVPPRPEPMEPRLPRPREPARHNGWGFEQIDLVNDNREVNNLFAWGMPVGLPGFLQRFGRGQRAEEDVQVIGGGLVNPPPQGFPFPAQNNANNVANPLAANVPNFNYQANGYNNGPGKAPYVPPPAPNEGFTRDTGPDIDAMCPSCEEELSYDPDEELNSPPSKKARNRKEREVHHFWAVKECGHVYCRKCFEGRRGTQKQPSTMRLDPKNNKKKVLCFVEDCDTDVTQKHSWVGIFL